MLLWIVIGLIVLWFLYRTTAGTKGVQTISAAALKQQLGKEDKQFLDVRTTGEFQAGHIKGFQNIPLQKLPSQLNKLDTAKETYVICQSGMRSSKACQLLRKHGFTNVINIKGGMNQYR